MSELPIPEVIDHVEVGRDVLTRIIVPGGAEDTWLERELVTPTNPAGLTAGTVSGDFLILDTANDAGGAPPNTGLGWPAGRRFPGMMLAPRSWPWYPSPRVEAST